MPQLPELDSLVAQFTTQLDAFVRDAVTAEVTAGLDGFTRQLLGTRGAEQASANPRAAAQRAGTTRSVTSASVSAPPIAQGTKKPRPCTVPGCGKPAAGPKYQWKCREHGVLRSAKKVAAAPTARALASAKAARHQPKARVPTDMPAAAQLGPQAKEKQLPPEVATLCRVPSCRRKHSGPRYDQFCREHFKQFGAEERRMLKQMWRAQHHVM